MGAKFDSLRLGDYEKFKLYKWLEENKEALEADRTTSYKNLVEKVHEALNINATDRIIEKACVSLGMSFRKRDGSFVSQMYEKLNKLIEQVAEHEEALRKVRAENAQLQATFLELATAPQGATYRVNKDGTLKRV